MYHCLYAGFMGDFHAVGEREESVGSHHGTFQVETETLCFGNGLAQGIDTRGLSYTGCVELSVLSKNNCVALRVLDNLVGEEEVGYLFPGEGAVGYAFEFVGGLYLEVAFLTEGSVEA